MSPTEKYLQAEGETYSDKWASDSKKKKFSKARKYILKLLKYAKSMLSILQVILLEAETYFSILPNN